MIFFDDVGNNPDDTLLFYYSGHGVPDVDGDIYLASSDTDPDKPYRRGFSLILANILKIMAFNILISDLLGLRT
jgi:hypothetical protein